YKLKKFTDNEVKRGIKAKRKIYDEEVKPTSVAFEEKEFGEIISLLMNRCKDLGLRVPENVSKVESKPAFTGITDDQSYLLVGENFAVHDGKLLMKGMASPSKDNYLKCRDEEKHRIEGYLEKMALMNAIDVIKPMLDEEQATNKEFKENSVESWTKFREMYGGKEKGSPLTEM